MEDILVKIVENKMRLLANYGSTLGCAVPERRLVGEPVKVLSQKFVIAEVKKASPSEGIIVEEFNPLDLAARYIDSGAGLLSVLTEPDFFGGSLEYLRLIKKTFPHIPILRKDFILNREELDVSYRVGADYVLLIASILSEQDLASLYEYALGLGLTPLVEVHSLQDIQKARAVKPRLVGINSRNLRSFTTDLILPFKLKGLIDWECQLVFESGIATEYEAELAFSGGFAGILTGTAVSRNPGLVARFATQAKSNLGRGKFWSSLYSNFFPKNYLLKLCGITNLEDYHLALESGADLVGFVLAPSPRQVGLDFIASLPEGDALKVAVVVDQAQDYPELRELVAAGKLDCVQFHGHESLEECIESDLPFYQVQRLGPGASPRSTKLRLLFDAFSKDAAGGTGMVIAESALAEFSARQTPDSQVLEPEYRRLWLAGGLNPSNIASISREYLPELLDLSSGVEASKGIKSREKVELFVKELKNAGL
ncbi:MAG: bifunctional indole-3-glycerol phosphate synthase/phosphoribosylanthranilate isomerase [Spirochaetales bacterium]|nr:bifunctional indole-3-glycerol phosphate synthase/phosphoribosylanthranilate isomerase [Spirochaetales bacterium]